MRPKKRVPVRRARDPPGRSPAPPTPKTEPKQKGQATLEETNSDAETASTTETRRVEVARDSKLVPDYVDTSDFPATYPSRCKICKWQKKGGCGTFQAIARCERHPAKWDSVERPVVKPTTNKIPSKPQENGSSTPERGGTKAKKRKKNVYRKYDDGLPKDAPRNCSYCGKKYKNLGSLRVHWYSCSLSDRYRGDGNKSRKPRSSFPTSSSSPDVAPASLLDSAPARRRRSSGPRCAECARNHQGGCGSSEAYYKCERKPENWVGKSTRRAGRPVAMVRPSGNRQHVQARLPFFIQFISTLQPKDRELAKTFWGQGVAPCDAKRKTPQDPWELLSTPLHELKTVLGHEDGKRIHASAMAFASGGTDEARLLATVRRNPKKFTMDALVTKFSAPEPLARWIRRLYHVLRVAGCGDDGVTWKCCGGEHNAVDVVGGGDFILSKELKKIKADKFNSLSVLYAEDLGEYDRCTVCQENYNLFTETHCPKTHVTFKNDNDLKTLDKRLHKELSSLSARFKCMKGLILDVEAAAPEQAVRGNEKKSTDNNIENGQDGQNGRDEGKNKQDENEKGEDGGGNVKGEHNENSDSKILNGASNSTETFDLHEEDRMKWINDVKHSKTVADLAACLKTLETWFQDSWYRKTFDRATWRENLDKLSNPAKSEKTVNNVTEPEDPLMDLFSLLKQFDEGFYFAFDDRGTTRIEESTTESENARKDAEPRREEKAIVKMESDTNEEKLEASTDVQTGKDGVANKFNKCGQCSRNPLCTRGLGHAGFCGGWRKLPTGNEMETNSTKRKGHSGFSKTPTCPTPTCPTPTCPRTAGHAGICGNISRMWYSDGSSISLPSLEFSDLNCKYCSTSEIPDKVTIDNIVIYAFANLPKPCKCLPKLTLPRQWSSSLPVWTDFGNGSMGWKTLPKRGNQQSKFTGSIVKQPASSSKKRPRSSDLAMPRRKRQSSGRARMHWSNPNSMPLLNADESKLSEMEKLSKKLQRVLFKKHLTQSKVAKITGICQSMISRFVRMPNKMEQRLDLVQALTNWVESMEATMNSGPLEVSNVGK